MVRAAKSKDNLRVLDGQNNSTSEENAKTTSDSSKTSALQKVNIGLDISSSVIGVCVLDHKTSALLHIFPVKLTSTKLEDLFDKAKEFERQFNANMNPAWSIENVFVEDIAKKFSSGFSSAGTITTLAKMNAMTCLTVYNKIGIKPKYVNVRSARAKLGIKINTKDKTKSTKEKVFEIVLQLNPKFPWLQHIAKTGKSAGQMVYDTCNQDMGDAWVVAAGGQILFP